MRTFRIQIVDEKDEVVIQYPIPDHYQHNGFGGGTETPVPDDSERKQIAWDLSTLSGKLRQNKVVGSVKGDYISTECDRCEYVAKGLTQKLADANLKLHKRFKHEGA
jgi:hypothetical protein